MSICAPITVHRREDALLTLRVDEDMTGWDLRFDLRNAYTDTGSLLTKLSPTSIALLSASATLSLASILFLSADLDLTPLTYVYTICRMNTGQYGVLTYGAFTILPPRVP